MGQRQERSAQHSQRNKGIAICVGLVITALAVLEGWQGWFYETYELKSYDTRMRWMNNISAHDQIVHIDIDDSSLARQKLSGYSWRSCERSRHVRPW